MRVLVCGGRSLSDKRMVFDFLNAFLASFGIDCIIEGGALGADKTAAEWARSRGVSLEEYPADWARAGKGAGPARNWKMLKAGKPDVVIAFPGGGGTKDMTDKAEKAGIRVVRVE